MSAPTCATCKHHDSEPIPGLHYTRCNFKMPGHLFMSRPLTRPDATCDLHTPKETTP